MSHESWKPVSYFITGDNISLNFIGSPPYSMRRPFGNPKRAARFDQLKARIQRAVEDGTQEEWEEIKSLFLPSSSVKEILEKTVEKVYGSQKIEQINGVYYYRGYKLSNYLVDKIESLIDDADESDLEKDLMLQPLTNFLENLFSNPSKRSLSELYRFVQHTKMPITEDGCLLAYKIVTHDYLDKHSRSKDNSIGAVVEEPRSLVDDDPTNACSSGLHFCSWNYSTGFFCRPDTDRMVVIKVNPMDVVSIPYDYNNEKGRCCKYTVMWEIPMDEVQKRDVLGMTA